MPEGPMKNKMAGSTNRTNTQRQILAFLCALVLTGLPLTNQFMILYHKSEQLLKISIGKAETRTIMLSRTAFERSKINLFEISIKHTYYDLLRVESIKDSVRVWVLEDQEEKLLQDLLNTVPEANQSLQHRKLNLSKNLLPELLVYTFEEHHRLGLQMSLYQKSKHLYTLPTSYACFSKLIKPPELS